MHFSVPSFCNSESTEEASGVMNGCSRRIIKVQYVVLAVSEVRILPLKVRDIVLTVL